MIANRDITFCGNSKDCPLHENCKRDSSGHAAEAAQNAKRMWPQMPYSYADFYHPEEGGCSFFTPKRQTA